MLKFYPNFLSKTWPVMTKPDIGRSLYIMDRWYLKSTSFQTKPFALWPPSCVAQLYQTRIIQNRTMKKCSVSVLSCMTWKLLVNLKRAFLYQIRGILSPLSRTASWRSSQYLNLLVRAIFRSQEMKETAQIWSDR